MTRQRDKQLDRKGVAAMVGIGVPSVDKYMQRGSIPKPDGVLGRSPWWYTSTIVKWDRDRPRRGYSVETHKRAAKQGAKRKPASRRLATDELTRLRRSVKAQPAKKGA